MGVVVETSGGRVEGTAADGHLRFRGIPYAAPPVGENRFAAPQPAEPWSGVRVAGEFGLAAPQPRSLLPGMEAGPQGEDCLSLNVYTPAADGERRPVMVWIHGGGFTGGSGSQALYEGAAFVKRGDVVLVTINYRLGILGYLHLADHAAQLPGAVSNMGQRDQVAALTWVRDNIERFGGDPGRVTIFGESAGGMAVSTLMAQPAARGLFHQVIAQSGAAHATHTRDASARVVDAVLAELDIAPGEIAKLRARTTDELLAAQVGAGQKLARDMFLTFAPAVDGDIVPEAPLEAIRGGCAADIPLLVGTNRDEWNLFSAMNPQHFELDDAALLKVASGRLGADDTEALLATYRSGREGAKPFEILDAFETDRRFRIPAIRLAEAHSRHSAATYMYWFTWASPARRGALGSCHALELPFVFGTLDAPTMDRFAGAGPDAERLAECMMDSWTAFGRTGNPGCAALPGWEPYTEAKRETMVFDRELAVVHGPDDAERAVWDGRL